MLKNLIKSFFLSGFLLSALAVKTDVDVTGMLEKIDLSIFGEHETVVLLAPEAMKALECIPSVEGTELHQVKMAIQQGVKVAPYDKAMKAVEQAMLSVTDVNNPLYKNLNDYKTTLLAGDLTLFAKEEMPARNNKKSKRFCKVYVKNLSAQCASICTLTAGSISGASTGDFDATCLQCNSNNFLLIRSSADVCGNLQFNSNVGSTAATGLLSAQGAWESGLEILRGIIGFNGTSGLTLSLNNLGAPFISNAFTVAGFIGTVIPTLISGAPAQFIFNPATNDVTANTNLAAFSLEGILGFKIHVDFGITFTNPPTIELTPIINDVNSLTNVTTVDGRLGSVTLSKFALQASNVTNTGFDLVILVFPESHEFLTVAQINGAIGGAGSNLLINLFNTLSIGILVDGKITP